jgi:signal transduction histidine kinase
VDLAQILQTVHGNVRDELDRRGIQWCIPDKPVSVWADHLALNRALQNLVDNALKYGGEGLSRVEVKHELTETHHVFSVRDDGVCLGPDQEEKVFSLFGRGETSIGTSGTGLGLAIVKEIAQRHGGDAWLDCGQGVGCAFYFSFSRELPH